MPKITANHVTKAYHDLNAQRVPMKNRRFICNFDNLDDDELAFKFIKSGHIKTWGKFAFYNEPIESFRIEHEPCTIKVSV